MEKKTIFAIAIDERVRWAFADASCHEVDLDHAKGQVFRDSTDVEDIAETVTACLQSIRDKWPESFSQCAGIGVGTAGVVDMQHGKLLHITRKNWLHNGAAVDFQSVFKPFFEHLKLEKNLVVQNDATAACLAEFKKADVNRLLYLIFDAGVNGGVTVNNAPLTMGLHPELGHIRPQIHPEDSEFDPLRHSGCPSHGSCFEGIASGARIERSWGAPLHALDRSHKAWRIIPNYIAQLAMSCTLMLTPERIAIGGSVMEHSDGTPMAELYDRVRKEFYALDNGYLSFPSMKEPEAFIVPGQLGTDATIAGALHLGRIGAFGNKLAAVEGLADASS